MGRICVPFDMCDALLLGELIPRFRHSPEFAAERLTEIAREPDKLMGLCAVASYYGFDFPCPESPDVSFLPWLVGWIAGWAAAGEVWAPRAAGSLWRVIHHLTDLESTPHATPVYGEPRLRECEARVMVFAVEALGPVAIAACDRANACGDAMELSRLVFMMGVSVLCPCSVM
jgi:hypothetical protein